MSSSRRPESSLHPPTTEQARQALDEARRHFQRALTGWVSDLLAARRAGRTEATWSADAPPLHRAA